MGNRAPWFRGISLTVILLVFGSLAFRVFSTSLVAGFASPTSPIVSSATQVPLFETRFASHGKTQSVHSAAVVQITGGRIRAFWYGGTHENASDVAIYTSVFDPAKGLWGSERAVMTPESTQRQLHRYIKQLGNVVVFKDRNDQLWLFYVSISVGRWSGSAINLTTSGDGGKTWSPVRRLITSPFLNLATLVKGPPFGFGDGTIGLPVYHEFMGTFGELLRVDRTGRVIHKTRLSWGKSSLQPVIIPRTAMEAIGLMRYKGPAPRRVLSFHTADGGLHWSAPAKTNLPNPNTAIAGLRLDNGDLVLVFNNSEYERDDLSLAYRQSDDKHWRIVHQFEKGDERSGEFSYPCIIRTLNGDFHLLYTWHKTHIKHIQFNQAWLEWKLKSLSHL